MSDTASLKFKTRQGRSKGANNALINDGYLLGNIVERGKDSVSMAIPKDEFRRSLSTNGRNAIYTLEGDDNNSYTVMVRDVQLIPVSNELHHVDFQVVSLTEEITVEVLINIIGQASVEIKGFIVNRAYDSIPVTGFPQDIPETIDVDVSGLGLNESISMGDIALNKVKTELDADELIISISEPRAEAEDDEDADDDVDVDVEVPVISDDEATAE